MNIYYVKMLLFTFSINTLLLLYNENYQNNHYNKNIIQNNTQGNTINSRLLAQTQNHNPHYHNDPELKEIIDKLNEEAIKKYQNTHHPYKQLKEVVEKNGTKTRGGHSAEPMSTLEKELLEAYEEMFDEKNHVMLKSGRYPNDGDKSDDLSSYECTDIDNAKLAKTKGRDKYLKHLKGRCTRGIYISSLATVIVTYIGLQVAKKAALVAFNFVTSSGVDYNIYASYITIFNMFNTNIMSAAIPASVAASAGGLSDLLPTAAAAATASIYPFSIAIYVLIAITVILIILYIWLYKRRKNSWKHECKKHLCR
ncbi:stevor [Plasmodium falciparum IGH-CR14]|uniref:Stevor n=1 Tax=Plasmodium falciparum IGH-CR14 TaxID=580059 RepID=A0A0L1ID80_PLAFA|nr:stevor [Plasmodium falciparum IGH-CR14]